MKKLTVLFSACLWCAISFAGDIDKAWEALNQNDLKNAQIYLQKAKQNPQTAFDAYLTDLLVRTFNGEESHLDGFLENLYTHSDRNEYLYALWFNGAVLGEYGKKTKPHQLDLLKQLIGEAKYNSSIKSAAHYVKAMHHLFANELDKAKGEWQAMHALENWQLAGPFENISGAGFNTAFGPLEHPESAATFIGSGNMALSWFTPARMNNEGWIFTGSHIPDNTAVIYAQTFVYAPAEMKVILNAGTNCALKVWVDDDVVISESKERTTELDYYKNYCTLHKGYNRVLLQLGYVDNDHPNFIIRFTDVNLNDIKDLKTVADLQPYSKGSAVAGSKPIPHFAEQYFKNRVETDSKNLLNYIMLCQVYLRNGRYTEARQVIQKGLQLAPENTLLRFELMQCYIKAGNQTLLLQEVERLKEKSPECYLTYKLNIDKLIKEEKWDVAEEMQQKMTALYGEDENSVQVNINLLSSQKKFEEMIKAIEAAYKRYPENITFLQYMYNVKKEGLKDAKGALALYEKFLKTNYNFALHNQLASAYQALGLNGKQLDVLKSLHDAAPYDPRLSTTLSDYFFEKQHYAKALEYAEEALRLAPFVARYWNNKAIIQEQISKTDAISSYRKTLYYDRTSYDARKKLNMLEQKPDLFKSLPQNDAYAIIKNAPGIDADHNFAYLLDEKSTIVYEEGASEEYTTTVVKIYNQKGIDAWKEYYISYNSNTQSLMVEKSEVVKSNGTKVPAERNDEAIVFTGLEAGDAIYIKYRLQNYAKGRIGREFTDKYIFNAFQPCTLSRYCLITPKNYNYKTQLSNGSVQPVVQELDDYKISTWESKNIPAIKSEPLMPPLVDVATVMHISTIKDWDKVAKWYSDISYQEVADDYDLNVVYNEIFAGKSNLSQYRKAKTIYEYIVTNIRYSSVPFRQSGLVPQSISKIINTKLGDCKDLSSLFVALADKAGLQAQLVLIDTRDNGENDVMLPTMKFNHCIALLKLDSKDYFIELTDSHLPFGSMPQNLYNAASLIIPKQGDNTAMDLKPLVFAQRTEDKMIRQIDVVVTGRDAKFKIASSRTGNLTSNIRGHYSSLPADKQKEDWEQSIAGNYKNTVKLEAVSFNGLDVLTDSIKINYAYTVKNEIVEAGSMKMLKVPFVDVIASNDNLSADTRKFPVDYLNYENTDVYESNISIRLPEGQKFIEIPVNQSFTFNKSSYSIKYNKVGETLKINRTATLDRRNIMPADYEKFKKFFGDIVEAETKYIVFK